MYALEFVGWLLNVPATCECISGTICSDNFTCCRTEIEVADQTFHLTQSQYTDIGPTSPSADPITPGAWQGSHWSANFSVTGMTRIRKKSRRKRDSNPGSSSLEADAIPLGQRGGVCVGDSSPHCEILNSAFDCYYHAIHGFGREYTYVFKII